MKKRKILAWGAGGITALVGFFLLLLALSASRTGRQYRAFEKKYAGAEKQATRLAAQLSEQLRTGADRPTSATRAVAAPSVFKDEIQAIQDDWRKLILEAGSNGGHLDLFNLLKRGIGGGTMILAASEFPMEGATGALRGGAELRERIRREAGEILGRDAARRPARLTATANALSSGTLAEKMERMLDRAGKLLLSDAAATGPMVDSRLYTENFELLGSAAALRAGVREQRGEAGRMLERLVHFQLESRMRRFPYPAELLMSRKVILLLAGDGLLADDCLARIDAMLKRARIDAKQLADLRAAYVLNLNRELEDADDWTYEMGMRDGRNRALLFMETQSESVANAALLAAIRPVMMSWVQGDEAVYDRALRHPLNATMMTAFRFPVTLAAFSRDPAANDAVDETRLIVAAARWRLARGSWPERIEVLIPRYLEVGFANGPESFYAVDRIEPPANAHRKDAPGVEAAAPRPVFYHARRQALTPQRLSALGSELGGRLSIGSPARLNEVGSSSMWARLGLRNEQQLIGMMTSSRRVEGIVVRTIWPSPDPLATGWLRKMKHAPFAQTRLTTSSLSSIVTASSTPRKVSTQ